uniref:(California timema) hypothetical protein n=1 Tax=Timema californicum TaxID=61474 RepID=A0A7R9PBY5_TIMCA|nr:unnamed protein product [Timema californicum]
MTCVDKQMGNSPISIDWAGSRKAWNLCWMHVNVGKREGDKKLCRDFEKKNLNLMLGASNFVQPRGLYTSKYGPAGTSGHADITRHSSVVWFTDNKFTVICHRLWSLIQSSWPQGTGFYPRHFQNFFEKQWVWNKVKLSPRLLCGTLTNPILAGVCSSADMAESLLSVSTGGQCFLQWVLGEAGWWGGAVLSARGPGQGAPRRSGGHLTSAAQRLINESRL